MADDPYEWIDPEVGRDRLTAEHGRLAIHIGRSGLPDYLIRAALKREAGVVRIRDVPTAKLPQTIRAFRALGVRS